MECQSHWCAVLTAERGLLKYLFSNSSFQHLLGSLCFAFLFKKLIDSAKVFGSAWLPASIGRSEFSIKSSVVAAWIKHFVMTVLHSLLPSHSVICQTTRNSGLPTIKTVVNLKPLHSNRVVSQTMMTQCPVRAVMTKIYTLLLVLGPCELSLETPSSHPDPARERTETEHRSQLTRWITDHRITCW